MSRRTAVLAAGVVAVVAVAAPALAITDRWAAWAPVTGTSNAFRTTMTQQSPGFPVATVVTDSRSPVSLPSGATTYLDALTEPGAKYGSSRNNPYLLLRPKADTASTPSTTTYTFAAPTPDTGWAFVLGDIDADAVRVRATDEDGTAVTADEVDSWFRGTFNYAGGNDEPTWDPDTATLTGNVGAVDTDGASGWFEPDIRLTSLTFTFSRRAGFPVYQTWFVSRARPIGGTVTDISGGTGSCTPTQATMTLLSPSGDVLATTRPAANGTYSFGEFATQADYTVRLDVPDTCAVVGSAEDDAVSNRGNDDDPASRADFQVRAIIPQPISGVVTAGPDAVPGVVVTLSGPGGTFTTTTGADGSYLFDDNAVGTGYSVSITPPPGYLAGPDGTTITGLTVDDEPIPGQDFELVRLPSVTGTVTGGGAGLGGVQVVLTPTGGGGDPITVATAGDGTYALDAVPLGAYTLSVVPPEGYTAPPERPVTVAEAGLTGEDFALARPGAVGGTVTRDGAPVAGVQVVVDGPGGPQTLTTDAEGQYFLDRLVPGSYTVTVRAPEGTVVSGPGSRTVTITAAGEVRGGQDFVLAAAPTTSPSPTATAPPPTTSPTPTDEPTDEPTETATDEPTASPSDGGSDGSDDSGTTLPDTGGPSGWLGAGSAGLVLLGLGLVVASRRRLRGDH